MRKKRELHVSHVFRDGSTDPGQVTVPAELVERIHRIRLDAETRARRIHDAEEDDNADRADSF